MRTKADFIKRLREDDLYKQALAKAKDDNERAAIARIVEGMVGNFADKLGPVIERAQNDPVYAEQLKRALVGDQQVLTDIEPEVSGSGGTR